MNTPSAPGDWAGFLRSNWEYYARHARRDFFIASHRGCDDPELWKAQGQYDAAIVLHGLAPERLARFQVLEIGCGVGRLAEPIAPRVAGYTGFDIAPSMVEEARKNCAPLANARFFLGDGLSVPAEARDRRYDVAFAHAVLVHCPKELVAVLLTSARALLAPGGELRFQLRAEASDPTGIQAPDLSLVDAEPPDLPTGALRESERAGLAEAHAVLAQRYYMGHAFRYDEVEPFLRATLPGTSTRQWRFDPDVIYVDVAVP